MRRLLLVCLLGCSSSKPMPAPPSNHVRAEAPIAELEIVTLIPRDRLQVSRDPDGSIRVLGPVHASVFVDGKAYGEAPVVVPATPGRHQVTVWIAGY